MWLPSVLKQSSAPLTRVQRGVWQVLMIEQPFLDFYRYRYWIDVFSTVPLIQRFFYDIYRLDPMLLILYVVVKLWYSVEGAVLLYFSTDLLRTVENGVKRNMSEHVTAIFRAILARLLCLVATRVVKRWCDQLIPDLQSRVTSHYEVLLLKAQLETDISTAQEPGKNTRATSDIAWLAFEGIAQLAFGICTTAFQIFFMMHSYRSIDPWFFLVCSARPLLEIMLQKGNLWGRPHVFFVNNPHFLRKKALKQMVSNEFKQDILCNNFVDYLLREYARCLHFLHGVSQDLPFFEADKEASTTFGVISDLVADFPMAYAAIKAVRNPGIFTVSSVAIVGQFSFSLRFALEGVFNSFSSLNQHMNQVRALYDAMEVKNTLSDGCISYPPVDKSSSILSSNRGMSLELCNVSFSYLNTQAATTLKNITLSIKPGQLVVVVGSNGSGKSTLMKLLSRLYSPTTGSILVDGNPIHSYKVPDLRSATAVLSQEHRLFPLSIAENIGLGYVERMDDREMILDSAEKGGAMKCIERLPEGLKTVLDPMFDVYSHNLTMDETGMLEKEMKKLRKAVDLSGGERQRIVASRTFMRFKTSKVKLVIVDEPSSALDAEGELQLFNNLRAEQEGKTMIFVTHRFGHLTRHADLIVCMKDGEAVESGTHDELMRIQGEYANLYEIQARAFVSGEENRICHEK